MKYDTLILSGGSVKGYAFIGSFKYLLDNKIIEIHKLKHIIGASVGAMMAIPLLLNVSIELYYKIIIQTNIKLYDKDLASFVLSGFKSASSLSFFKATKNFWFFETKK